MGKRMEETMKKDAKTMKKVAERCTQYAPNGECHCTNSTAGNNDQRAGGRKYDCLWYLKKS